MSTYAGMCSKYEYWGACPPKNPALDGNSGNTLDDIPHTSFGAERLAKSIVADLFVEDRDYHFQTLEDYNELELDGEEWPGRI